MDTDHGLVQRDEAASAALPADNHIGAVTVVVTISRAGGACVATLRLDPL
jgi:hypothetical protein